VLLGWMRQWCHGGTWFMGCTVRRAWWKVGALPLIVCGGVTVVRAHSGESATAALGF